MTVKPAYIAAGAAVVAALAWVAWSRPQSTGAAIGGAVVDLADGVVSGVVVGIGEKVGIPATNQTQCQQDMAAGRTWQASFSCPAGTFVKYLWS